MNFYGKTKAQGILEWKVYKPGLETSMQVGSTVKPTLNVYPNPAKTNVYVELNNSKKSELFIFNTTGTLLFSKNFYGKIEIPRSEFAGFGVFVVAVSNNGYYQCKKVLVY
jgi:hypothetical protein